MLSKTIQDILNDQIKHELYSAYLYLSMSAYCEAANLPGCAHWLRVQAGEEQGHALKIFDHIIERGGQVTLQAIPQPPTEFASALDLFEQVLEHEKKVTGLINRCYEAAVKENDYPAQIMLQWFVEEQVEEEKNASEIVARLKMVGAQGTALFMLDRMLGERK
jgi:ferritin